jgi:hypothetical protein
MSVDRSGSLINVDLVNIDAINDVRSGTLEA